MFLEGELFARPRSQEWYINLVQTPGCSSAVQVTLIPSFEPQNPSARCLLHDELSSFSILYLSSHERYPHSPCSPKLSSSSSLSLPSSAPSLLLIMPDALSASVRPRRPSHDSYCNPTFRSWRRPCQSCTPLAQLEEPSRFRG